MADQSINQILGQKSEYMFRLKEQNRILDQQMKENRAKIEEANNEILAIMEAEEIEKLSTNFGSHSRKIMMHPSIDSWDEFTKYVSKTGSFHMLQKRLSAPPIREMFQEEGILPPGLDSYMKETLNSRINPSFRMTIISED